MLRLAVFALIFVATLSFGDARALAGNIENSGTGVAIALPLIAGGVAFAHERDWTGMAELGVDTLATIATAYALKHLVREQRPDHSDFQSFPSDTAALAFAPAAFLWDRYGWRYGLPAYAVAGFVAYSRVDARKHHWYDVAASAGIAWGYSRIFTTEYHRRGVYSSLDATPDGAFVHVSYNF